MSGEEGSLGEIRKALAGITRRLDALADVVGVAATAEPGALLDEPTRARLAGVESLLAIGRGTTRSEACLLAVDRALTHARADCAAILWPSGEAMLAVLAQRGFRLPVDVRADEGIVGRAIRSAELVQAGPGLGGPDPRLDRHGLGAALAIPVPDRTGLPRGALLVGRRRPVPFDPEAVATLVTVADRLADALLAPLAGSPDEATPSALFMSLDPARTARAVATEAAARLGAAAVAVFLPDGEGFALAGGTGLPDDAPAAGATAALVAVAATRRAWIRTPEDSGDPGLARCLGTTPRAVLPLLAEGGPAALLAIGSPDACGTALTGAFEHAAALALRNARLHAESLGRHAEPPPPAFASETGAAPLGEMANLLAVVLGRLAAVRDRVTDGQAARDLAQAEEAAWRVAEGVRRVLGFPPGPAERAVDPLDLAAAVRDSVRAMERLWADEGHGSRVTVDLEPVPPVRVDPDELRQALDHLLQNAREAGQGAGPIAVWLRWNGTTHVELAVSDRGRGMDEPTRARADEPFFTTKGPGRLGVGLAVVRAMASRYRGGLDIESVPGQGTTVRLRLPAAGAPRSAPAPPVSSAQPRVLVVDDDRAVRETIVEGLSRAGYMVHATGDVGDAVEALGREPVDLVVTDLVLPGGSGLEIARTVKRMRPGIPVILVTGWPGRVDQRTLEGQGVDAVVQKPVGLDALQATVAALIERASARPA